MSGLPDDWDNPDRLAALMNAIRRHILDAPRGAWDPEMLQAARTVTQGVAGRLETVPPNGGRDT